MGFAEVLLLLFIALKLMGFIDWSWWLVLAPLWASILIYLSLFVVIYRKMR